jgi:hypothetical protein
LGELGSEQRCVDADPAEELGLADAGPDGDTAPATLRLVKGRHERVRPPWDRFDARKEHGHRQASGPREGHADPAAA